MVVFQSGLLFFFFFFFFHRSTDTSARWGPSCLLIRDRVVSVVAPCETADCIFRAILFLIVVYVCFNTVAAVRSVMNATGFRLIVCNDNDDKVLSMWHYVFARPGRLLICHQPSLCKVSLIFKTFSYSKWFFFCVCVWNEDHYNKSAHCFSPFKVDPQGKRRDDFSFRSSETSAVLYVFIFRETWIVSAAVCN